MLAAEEYHKRCDEFDATVCTGKRNGEPFPADSWERHQTNRNSLKVREALMREHGLTGQEFLDAVRTVSSRRERERRRKSVQE